MENKPLKLKINEFFKGFAILENWFLFFTLLLIPKIIYNLRGIVEITYMDSEIFIWEYKPVEILFRVVQIVLSFYLLYLLYTKKKKIINFAIYFLFLNFLVRLTQYLNIFSFIESKGVRKYPDIYASMSDIAQNAQKNAIYSFVYFVSLAICIKRSKQVKETFIN